MLKSKILPRFTIKFKDHRIIITKSSSSGSLPRSLLNTASDKKFVTAVNFCEIDPKTVTIDILRKYFFYNGIQVSKDLWLGTDLGGASSNTSKESKKFFK